MDTYEVERRNLLIRMRKLSRKLAWIMERRSRLNNEEVAEVIDLMAKVHEIINYLNDDQPDLDRIWVPLYTCIDRMEKIKQWLGN